MNGRLSLDNKYVNENIIMDDAKISIQSLACVDLYAIRNCFNASFNNYYLPVHLTREELADKLITEAIDLKLSFGIFDGDQLVGFVLNGIDITANKKMAYNTANGILPEYRGYHLSDQLYEHSIAQLKKAGIEKIMLDVIEQNIPAVKLYQRFGFAVTRKLNGYKGVAVLNNLLPVEIETVTSPDWELIRKYCEWKPSWQYDTNCIKRALSNYTLQVATCNNLPVAYCISNIAAGTVAHFGCCQMECKEVYLYALFNQVRDLSNNHEIAVINVDTDALYANTFLLSIGLSRYFTSCEMEMVL